MASSVQGPVMSANAGNVPKVTGLPLSSSGRLTNNVLLVKDLVGKTRPTVYTLPGLEHVYGKRVERDPNESAATVLNHWHIRSSSATIKASPPPLDYIAMNRNSAKQGLKKQIRAYRKLHPIRIHVADHHRADGTLGKKAPLPSDNDITFTYGKPTRPSTPVGALMTDKYQREWLEQQEKKVKENSKKNVLKKKPKYPSSSPNERPGKPVKIQPIALRDPATLWKLPKFTRTPAHLDTYRRKDDPALSFEAAPEPVFRIVNDKWLGLQPRELTRPIYMQDEFNKRVERTQAGGRKKKEEEKTTEKEKDKKETGKEVRFTVQDWKSGNEKVHATTTDVSESEVKVHEPIRTMTEVHTSPAHIDATVIESHKNQPAANSKDTARKTTTMHACPTSGIATITNQTETVGGQKTITTTEIATDPVTRVSFADTYQTVPGAAPLPGERKPAAILKGTGKIDRMLPELPRKVGDYRAVEGTITV